MEIRVSEIAREYHTLDTFIINIYNYIYIFVYIYIYIVINYLTYILYTVNMISYICI